MMFRHNMTIPILILNLAFGFGCTRTPGRLFPPSINASAAGAEAIAMYDTDKDGRLNSAELDKCPALMGAMAQIDIDGDKAISANEITKRIVVWQDSKLGRMPFSCTVLHNGRPLPDAEVRFVPERFLGENMKTATGKTNINGIASISVGITDRSVPSGIAPGFYRIEITKIGESIPSKYNTATAFGQEVAKDVAVIRKGLRFNLSY